MNRPFYVAGSEISGSVIQQAPGSEIMVVDFEKDDDLRQFYEETMAELKTRGWGSIMLPNLINERIREVMKYDVNISNGLIDGTAQKNANDITDISPETRELIEKCPTLANEKIYVGSYIKLGVGVCRQMGLIAAACLERAIKQGNGGPWIKAEYRGLYGGVDPHAWAVAIKNDDTVVAIDPAGNYCGPETDGNYPYYRGYENHIIGKPNS